jgi:hypothetical protein
VVKNYLLLWVVIVGERVLIIIIGVPYSKSKLLKKKLFKRSSHERRVNLELIKSYFDLFKTDEI